MKKWTGSGANVGSNVEVKHWNRFSLARGSLLPPIQLLQCHIVATEIAGVEVDVEDATDVGRVVGLAWRWG
jgi:hypothetical protein